MKLVFYRRVHARSLQIYNTCKKADGWTPGGMLVGRTFVCGQEINRDPAYFESLAVLTTDHVMYNDIRSMRRSILVVMERR